MTLLAPERETHLDDISETGLAPVHDYRAVTLPPDRESVLLWTHDTVVGDPADGQTAVTLQRVRYKVRADKWGNPTVAKVTSEMVTGHHAASGKSWSKWSTTGLVILRPGAGGSWLMFIRERKWNMAGRGGAPREGGPASQTKFRTNHVFAENLASRRIGLGRHPENVLDEHLVGYALANLGAPASENQAYPLLDVFRRRRVGLGPVTADEPRAEQTQPDYSQEAWAPAQIRRAFAGTETAQDLTRALFGKSRYRRDLVKEVAQAQLVSLVLAWQFRGLVPIDWIVDMLRADRIADEQEQARERENKRLQGSLAWRGNPARASFNHFSPVRHHLRNLDQNSLRRLMRDGERLSQDTRYLVHDMSTWDTTPVTSVRSWRELHDRSMVYAGRVPARAANGAVVARAVREPYEAQLRPAEAAIVGTTPAGREVYLATHEDTLLGWGVEMKQCIGGYGRQMSQGTSLLGAVCVEGSMKANFEITATYPQATEAQIEAGLDDEHPGCVRALTLRQLMGKANVMLDAELRSDVEAHLRAHGVAVGDYWGSNTHPGLGTEAARRAAAVWR